MQGASGWGGASPAIPLSRSRFAQGDFVAGGGDGAQANRDVTGNRSQSSATKENKANTSSRKPLKKYTNRNGLDPSRLVKNTSLL